MGWGRDFHQKLCARRQRACDFLVDYVVVVCACELDVLTVRSADRLESQCRGCVQRRRGRGLNPFNPNRPQRIVREYLQLPDKPRCARTLFCKAAAHTVF